MTLNRIINFAVFLVACSALAAVHFMWMAAVFPSKPMFIYSGVCLVVMVGTIILEGRMMQEGKRRGFEVDTDTER